VYHFVFSGLMLSFGILVAFLFFGLALFWVCVGSKGLRWFLLFSWLFSVLDGSF